MARPMTMAEKILAAHAGLDEVKPGQLIECDLDLVLANDVTAPLAIKTAREITDAVFDADKIALVPDHYAPNKDIKSAEQAKIVREFAHEQGISHYYEVGCMGRSSRRTISLSSSSIRAFGSSAGTSPSCTFALLSSLTEIVFILFWISERSANAVASFI